MIELLWLLLPVAAASGWWIAKQETPAKSKSWENTLDFSLDEPAPPSTTPWAANEALALEVGRFLRQQGDVSQAIFHHRHLLTQFPYGPLHQQLRWELAEDFLTAGLIDRATELFNDLLTEDGWQTASYRKLIELAERQQHWQHAIALSEKLHQRVPHEPRVALSHYRCELAERAYTAQQPDLARSHLQQALADHRPCGRAWLRWGQWAAAAHQERDAFDAWRQLSHEVPALLEDIALDWLAATPTRHRELLTLWQTFDAHQTGGQFTRAFALLLRQHQGDDAARRYLRDKLARHPTASGLALFLDDAPRDLRDAARSLLTWPRRYRCHRCGYTGAQLHWRCPSCRTWETTFPLLDGLPPWPLA